MLLLHPEERGVTVGLQHRRLGKAKSRRGLKIKITHGELHNAGFHHNS
jgi:hypothetical protein